MLRCRNSCAQGGPSSLLTTPAHLSPDALLPVASSLILSLPYFGSINALWFLNCTHQKPERALASLNCSENPAEVGRSYKITLTVHFLAMILSKIQFYSPQRE